MDHEKISAYFGHEYMNHDAIDAKPIDFDFYNQPRDLDYGDGDGRWCVAPIPDVESMIEDLDEIEISDETVSITLAPPDRDGDVEITITDLCTDGEDGWLGRAILLAGAHGLTLPGVERDDADGDGDHVISVTRRALDAWHAVMRQWDLDPEIFDAREADDWEPVMNYAYPLPLRDVPDDWHLRVRSCTIVLIDGAPHLALTGGGMDHSWEIVQSYLALGCWPPVHFARLPRMAGRGHCEKDRMILEACAYSCRTMAAWCQSRLAEVESMIAAASESAA